jgi:hypothetical protein
VIACIVVSRTDRSRKIELKGIDVTAAPTDDGHYGAIRRKAYKLAAACAGPKHGFKIGHTLCLGFGGTDPVYGFVQPEDVLKIEVLPVGRPCQRAERITVRQLFPLAGLKVE